MDSVVCMSVVPTLVLCSKLYGEPRVPDYKLSSYSILALEYDVSSGMMPTPEFKLGSWVMGPQYHKLIVQVYV